MPIDRRPMKPTFSATSLIPRDRFPLRRHGWLRALAAALATLALAGCFPVGPTRLDHDQVDYARTLADAKKRQTLASIVGLRFADAPAFLTTSQIIAAYSFNATGNAGTTFAPGDQNRTTTLGGTVSFANNPTFTFAPVTGEAYANAYIRPLDPSLILPLAQGGAPIDVLLRLAAQSLGPLQNSGALGGAQSDGSPSFYACIHALRRLQIAGAMNVQYAADKDGNHVYLQLAPDAAADPAAAQADVATVRHLLKLRPDQDRFEIVYGQGDTSGSRVPLLTRSVLGILASIGAQVDVPEADIRHHDTLPTVHFAGVETRPVVIVHAGGTAPGDAYVSARYQDTWYWIDTGDFDSKYAFNVLQNIMSLAESSDNKAATLVTIPAG